MEKKYEYINIAPDGGEELKDYIDQNGQNLKSFGPISHVNILVGATNSGKSRFMRGLAKNAPYISIQLDSDNPAPQHILNTCRQLEDKDFSVHIVVNPQGDTFPDDQEVIERTDFGELGGLLVESLRKKEPRSYTWNAHTILQVRNTLEQMLLDRTTQGLHWQRELTRFANWIRFGLTIPTNIDKKWYHIEKKGVTTGILDSLDTILNFIKIVSSETVQLYFPQITYIPVLRTAMTLDLIGSDKGNINISRGNAGNPDLLSRAIVANYNFNQEAPSKSKNTLERIKVEVFTGNSLYQIIHKELSGEAIEMSRLKAFERFLQENFFAGDTIELRALGKDHSKGQRLSLFVNEVEIIPMKDWGDGIQAIVIIMYRIFTSNDGAWIFIEEPEQGLHPGLQRTFLNCLSNDEFIKSKNLTIFMTTHSNHLLGIALSELEDVSVFSFQERGFPGPFEIRPIFTPETELLELLGTSNTSVFLANCGIWVEGITDRRYLRAYLAAYLVSDELKDEFKPREDIHYAFFEYAGSNLAHYMFETDDTGIDDIKARFLSNRIFLLADKDEGKDAKHKRLEAIQDDNFVYKITAGKEIENLISPQLLKLALPKLISNLAESDIGELRLADYFNEGLGDYIKEILGDNCPEPLMAKSGTLTTYYKNKLSRIMSEIVTWEDMGNDAKELTRELYQFIYRHNQPMVIDDVGKN